MSTNTATIPAVVTAAIDEVERARRLFPRPDHLVLALAEEAGEVVKAALDIRNKKQGATTVELRREIVQTMAMCIRLAEEGDPTIGVYGLRVPDTDLAVLIRQEEIAAAVFMHAAQPLSDIHFVGSPYFARPRLSSDPVDVGSLVAENARLKAALATERGYAAEAWDILARGGVRCRELSTQAAGTISYVKSLEVQIAALRAQVDGTRREIKSDRSAMFAHIVNLLHLDDADADPHEEDALADLYAMVVGALSERERLRTLIRDYPKGQDDGQWIKRRAAALIAAGIEAES